MKGYNLSIDYEKLWKLIHDGYRVPAWILYDTIDSHEIYDLVEVKVSQFSGYLIGSRGIGYEGVDDGEKGFIMTCQWKQLKFIEPQMQ